MCKKCIFLVDSLYCFKHQCEVAEIKLKKKFKKFIESNDYNACTSNKGRVKMTIEYLLTFIENLKINSINCLLSNLLHFYLDQFLAGNLSDTVISSEEEYHIEYASEEAKLEVENARKRRQKAKKKLTGVKVKSVEILGDTDRSINKNLAKSRSKYVELKEV